MVGAVSLPISAWLLGYPWPVIAFGVAAAAGVVFLHRGNIRRLARGEENRFRLRRRKERAAGSLSQTSPPRLGA
jgi:hypothetical protein